jgi:hypothetical protein
MFSAMEAAMPNKGQTPILIIGTATGGATPTYSAEVRVQKGTIDDLASGFLAAVAQKMAKHHDGDDGGVMAPPMPAMPVAPPSAPPPKKKK